MLFNVIRDRLFCVDSLFGEKVMSFVLFGFIDSLFAVNHAFTSFNSSFILLCRSGSVLALNIRLVSSANKIIGVVIVCVKSLMYIRKSKGPSTDPCGTPVFIGRLVDLFWLMVTY